MSESEDAAEKALNERNGVELAEETESSSSRENANDENGTDDGSSDAGDYYKEAEDYREPMPLLSYTRLFGSLPRCHTNNNETAEASGANQNTTSNDANSSRAFSVQSNCAVMGQVLLASEDSSKTSTSATSPDQGQSYGNQGSTNQRQQVDSVTATENAFDVDLLTRQPHFVVAMGFHDGSVQLLDAKSGRNVAPPGQLKLRDTSAKEPVVDLSIDSSGTFLAAVDAGRMVVIWEFRYGISVQPVSNQLIVTSSGEGSAGQSLLPSTSSAEAGVFSSFMSALTGAAAINTASPLPESERQSTSAAAATPRLVTSSAQLSRISYPRSFGVPTCIAIDPAYRRKRDKAVLTGFRDGRLVLTKRGFFQRRTDAIIYQGTYESSNTSQGIEAIEWRGSLVAWADASGIRLYDTDSSSRIAYVDRPKGARPSLYPTLSYFRPSLLFETSNYLLVAWGDCLMGLSITDHGQHAVVATDGQASNLSESSTMDSTQAPQTQQQQHVVRRRTVECAMAWELDAVAAGVAPLDKDHVLLLGLVPPSDDDEFDEETWGQSGQSCNDVELQIIRREDGDIVFSNILPLLRDETKVESASAGRTKSVAQAVVSESASNYTLLSSFALPRMEDAYEVSEQPGVGTSDDFDLQMSLFTNQTAKSFVDSHLKWSIQSTNFDSAESGRFLERSGESDNSDDDISSVDSDCYAFILQPLSTNDCDNMTPERLSGSPPLMVITSSSDAVLGRMRDVDDAVRFALESGRSALALQRGLRNRRQLRRYQISELVNEYFISLLKIPRDDTEGPKAAVNELSIKRLKLASNAMPVLFGGDTHLWERWVAEVERIPGALFILSDHLPVRDPRLPKELYGRVLEHMLNEIEDMKANGKAVTDRPTAQAEQCFLEVLEGWGPTDFLKEHIKLCKIERNHIGSSLADAVRRAEERFDHRFTQTSACYLNFPVQPEDQIESNAETRICSEGYYETKSALFDVDDLLKKVSKRVSFLEHSETEDATSDGDVGMNSRVAIDALARLFMMKGQYDSALKCFLIMGDLHSGRTLGSFQAGAVAISVTTPREIDRPWKGLYGIPYTFLLDFIDNHHLQQCFLDANFLATKKKKYRLPLLTLLQLVGFQAMGKFMIEHCVPPQKADRNVTEAAEDNSSSSIVEERRGTLPLDLVAKQLDGNPRILYWYLDLVFTHKPEVYVKFPNTAYPPIACTDLHRRHFDLCVKYSGSERDSAKFLSGIEAYKVGGMSTRLLLLLKAALPLGGIRPKDARTALERERDEDRSTFSTSFALELAYILEHYGEDSESEALQILELHMKGSESMVLAVSFAQRNATYSAVLWNKLIQHCLAKQGEDDQVDGSQFGSLLEAAALAGADLAKLVARIPPGMAVEGLRPRLVAAVADYRLKLKMHEAASETATQEMISILRELNHRSRRGTRHFQKVGKRPSQEEKMEDNKNEDGRTYADIVERNVLPPKLRTRKRPDRFKLGLAPPFR